MFVRQYKPVLQIHEFSFIHSFMNQMILLISFLLFDCTMIFTPNIKGLQRFALLFAFKRAFYSLLYIFSYFLFDHK